MKLSKQQLGLVVVAGVGVCALGVDHFVLRPGGGISTAIADVGNLDVSPLDGEPQLAAGKEVIDRSSASIADRLVQLSSDNKGLPRDAFCEPWHELETVPQAVSQEAVIVSEPSAANTAIAPWKLTSVSSIGGKWAVVLNRDTVLIMGSGIRDNAELLSASATHGEAAWAKVREVSSGKEFLLQIETQAKSSEK